MSGDRTAYRLEPRPLGTGGYAEVFKATHKETGDVVAFKRLKDVARDAQPRMRREIEVLGLLDPHLPVMPVFDADPDHTWYVMPLAAGDLVALRDELATPVAIAGVLECVCEALRAAHELGYIHRDITPHNILAIDAPAGRRWVLADWGLVRGPQGRTTNRWTKPGQMLGTEGFIAPELLRDAHEEASPSVDVFSLGRVLAWATTGEWPLAGETLVPSGPFRQLVRAATHKDIDRRVSIEEFSAQLRDAAYTAPVTVQERALALSGLAIGESDTAAARELFELASEHRDDAALYFDHIARLRGPAISALLDDETLAEDVVTAMHDHMVATDDRWGGRNFDAANRPLGWFHAIAVEAERRGLDGVLEDASRALFEAEVAWRRFSQRRITRRWLVGLNGGAAEAAARALRAHPDAVEWYREEGWSPGRGVHAAIRDALGPL